MSKIKGLLLAVILGVTAFACFFVREYILKEDFYYSGTLEATKVVIPSKISSQITEFDVKEGDRIQKGQAIAKLDNSELVISLKDVTSKYERSLTLFKSGRLPQKDLETIEAERDRLKLKMEWSTIRSPTDGVVLAKFKEAGEWVTQGVGVLSVADIKNIWAFFYIEQNKIAQLSIGTKIKGTVPEIPEKTFSGRIIKINSEPEFTPKNVQTREERTRLVYGIKVQFENEDETLKPGMTIETELTN
jgi:HlyD family secretion protein